MGENMRDVSKLEMVQEKRCLFYDMLTFYGFVVQSMHGMGKKNHRAFYLKWHSKRCMYCGALVICCCSKLSLVEMSNKSS